MNEVLEDLALKLLKTLPKVLQVDFVPLPVWVDQLLLVFVSLFVAHDGSEVEVSEVLAMTVQG